MTHSGYTTGDVPIGTSLGSDVGTEEEPGHGSDWGADRSTTGTTTGLSGQSGQSGQSTASTAVDQGKKVAGTATEEAGNVAGTAAQQARNVVGDAVSHARSQVSDQATTQRDRLSETLHTLGDDLESMAGGDGAPSGMAADLVREVSQRARSLGSHLDGREPAELLEDVRDFARRRPGTFLVAALAAGVVAGRLFRGTADGAAAAELGDADLLTAGSQGHSPDLSPDRAYDTTPDVRPGAGAGAGAGAAPQADLDEVLGTAPNTTPATTSASTPATTPAAAASQAWHRSNLTEDLR